MWVGSTESSRGISKFPSSNNIPSSPPSGPGSIRKALSEEKCDDELPAGIGNDYYVFSLVIDGDFKIDDVSIGNGSMSSHIYSLNIIGIPIMVM